jgi:hypothetical protein
MRRKRLVGVFIVMVGIGIVPSTEPAIAHALHPAVWVGAPAPSQRWAVYSSSLPQNHATYYWGNPYRGDWSVDLKTSAGSEVRVYAAPNNTSLAIAAKVERVLLACAARSGESWEQTRRRGGQTVVVGFYHGGSQIGTAAYAHINPTVSGGQWISRWGTLLGDVGAFSGNSCWDGSHIHFELLNMHHYACFNRGYGLGQTLYKTNFVGFIGGDYARSAKQPCP